MEWIQRANAPKGARAIALWPWKGKSPKGHGTRDGSPQRATGAEWEGSEGDRPWRASGLEGSRPEVERDRRSTRTEGNGDKVAWGDQRWRTFWKATRGHHAGSRAGGQTQNARRSSVGATGERGTVGTAAKGSSRVAVPPVYENAPTDPMEKGRGAGSCSEGRAVHRVPIRRHRVGV